MILVVEPGEDHSKSKYLDLKQIEICFVVDTKWAILSLRDCNDQALEHRRNQYLAIPGESENELTEWCEGGKPDG